MLTPAEVITAWGELTGQTWRLLPQSVQFQASEFCTAGFTLEEMRLVVLYTKKKIVREEDGFNAQSIAWRVMADDRWLKFQERLEAAKQTKLGKIIMGGGEKPAKRAEPETRNEKRETPSFDPDEIKRTAAKFYDGRK